MVFRTVAPATNAAGASALAGATTTVDEVEPPIPVEAVDPDVPEPSDEPGLIVVELKAPVADVGGVPKMESDSELPPADVALDDSATGGEVGADGGGVAGIIEDMRRGFPSLPRGPKV